MLEKGGTTAASETGRRAQGAERGRAQRGTRHLPRSPAQECEGALEGVCRDVL